jgi:hypothetical protein
VIQSSYNIAIMPQVAVSGAVSGATLSDTFAPTLNFQLDPLKLTLAGDTKSNAQLQPTQDGAVKFTHEATNTLGALGYGVPVSTARVLALGVAGCSALGLLWLLVQTLRLLRSDEARQIRAKHGDLLVTVSSTDATSGRSIVELSSFDELRRFAVAHGRMIMHYAHDGRDDFYVREDGAVYCYRTAQSQSYDESPEPPSGHNFDETGPLPVIERRAANGAMRGQRASSVSPAAGAAQSSMRMQSNEC